MTAGVDPGLLQAYADVVLRCGVNVEQGQKVLLGQRPGGDADRDEVPVIVADEWRLAGPAAAE